MTQLDRTFGYLLTCAHILSALLVLGSIKSKIDCVMALRLISSSLRVPFGAVGDRPISSQGAWSRVFCLPVRGTGWRRTRLVVFGSHRSLLGVFSFSFLRSRCRNYGTHVMVLSCPLLTIKYEGNVGRQTPIPCLSNCQDMRLGAEWDAS